MIEDQLAPHQQRVVAEKADLDANLGRLLAFMQTTIYAALPVAERSRLIRQSAAMRMLSNVLGERIFAFGES